MAQLTIAVECTYPSDEEINAIYKAVESEFFGCYSMKKRHRFHENRKERVMDKMLVVVKTKRRASLLMNTGKPLPISISG